MDYLDWKKPWNQSLTNTVSSIKCSASDSCSPIIQKHPASIALKEISLQVTHSDKKQFTEMLSQWHKQWRAYLEEKTYSENGVSFIYTHRRLRAAYFGLTRHLDVLYTYQSFLELGLPNTNNALESLNASLKTKLRLHRGISRERKQRLIQSIIISYNPSSIKGS